MSKIFSHAEYQDVVAETVAEIEKLGKLKGGEYAGDIDRLANFRRNGQARRLPMEVIWSVYFAKHHDAIHQWIDDIVDGKERERLEPIEGRIDDMIVYLILLKCMVRERARE